MKKIRSWSLNYSILKSLDQAIDGFVRVEDILTRPNLYAEGYKKPLKKASLIVIIQRMVKQGLIQRHVTDFGQFLRLTDQGREFLQPEEFKRKPWDGKYRIVIFDVPEEKRTLRNLFRRNLKKWEFMPLQRSVYVSKLDVYILVKEYIKELGLEDSVIIIQAEKMSTP